MILVTVGTQDKEFKRLLKAVDKAIEVSKEKLMDNYKTIDSIKDVIIISEDDLNSKVSLSLFVKTIEDITKYKEALIEEDTPNN